MKYFIGYLIQGDATEWHRKVAKDISEKFGLWKIHEKIRPHITIFRPFEVHSEKIVTIKNLLKEWTQSQVVPGNMTLTGYDRFDDRVVFAHVDAEKEVRSKVEELRKLIKEIPDIPEEDFPQWNPHATLMNMVEPEYIEKVWQYVNTLEKPNFILPFDNVTLFRFEGERKWVADEVFNLA